MDLTPIKPYITGEKFSNGLEIDCSTSRPILERMRFIVERTKGKKAIHVGFTDHLPLIEEKVASGRWLHKRLADACERCVGLDINREAIDFVRDTIGIGDVFYFDIFNDEPLEEFRDDKFDFLILGDVIEHTNGPVEFLSLVREKFNGVAENLLITVPNAFDFANVRLLRRNRELINTDHRYWFTPFTLAKVVSEAKLEASEFGYCNPPYHRNGLVSRVLKRYPILSETVYCIARLDDERK